jgi:hypothetical protein
MKTRLGKLTGFGPSLDVVGRESALPLSLKSLSWTRAKLRVNLIASIYNLELKQQP